VNNPGRNKERFFRATLAVGASSSPEQNALFAFYSGVAFES